MADEQQVDWIEAAPGEEVKRMVNQSIRLHNQREFELEEIKKVESRSDQVRLLLLYEKE
jgi:hypothetical protein